jgi:hypothetical protein
MGHPLVRSSAKITGLNIAITPTPTIKSRAYAAPGSFGDFETEDKESVSQKGR